MESIVENRTLAHVAGAAGIVGQLAASYYFILVPALALLYGTKQGIAVASLLLAGNNIAKVVAYRKTIPLRPAAGILALTLVGSVVGPGSWCKRRSVSCRRPSSSSFSGRFSLSGWVPRHCRKSQRELLRWALA